MKPPSNQPISASNKLLSTVLFGSRWLQVPLYLGLIAAQLVYVVHFMVELEHLVVGTFTLTEEKIMLIVLGLIDVVMISNLLIMVIVGGYETFVSRLNLEGHPDEPEWLSHVNANVLKVKLATAIIGISSIHLLKSFINAPNLIDRRVAMADRHPHGVHRVGRLDRVYRQADAAPAQALIKSSIEAHSGLRLRHAPGRTMGVAADFGNPGRPGKIRG